MSPTKKSESKLQGSALEAKGDVAPKPDNHQANATVRQKDIARALGVSETTVSLTLDGSGRISEETRRKVWEKVKEMGYVPNPTARALRTRKPDTVAVVHAAHYSPFGYSHTRLMHGFDESLATRQMNLIKTYAPEGSESLPERLRLLLRDSRIGGVLAIMEDMEEEDMLELRELDTPFVWVGGYPELGEDWGRIACVGPDNVGAARRLTRELVQEGHRHFAFMTGPLRRRGEQLRLHGLKLELAEWDLELATDCCIEIPNPSYHESVRKGLSKLLAAEVVPTAIIASTDFLASLLMRHLMDNGYLVPHHFSVAGFGNDPYTWSITPCLTTMDMEPYQVGNASVHCLFEIMEQPDVVDRPQQLIRTHLMRRSSIAAPREKLEIPRLPIREGPGTISYLSELPDSVPPVEPRHRPTLPHGLEVVHVALPREGATDILNFRKVRETTFLPELMENLPQWQAAEGGLTIYDLEHEDSSGTKKRISYLIRRQVARPDDIPNGSIVVLEELPTSVLRVRRLERVRDSQGRLVEIRGTVPWDSARAPDRWPAHKVRIHSVVIAELPTAGERDLKLPT